MGVTLKMTKKTKHLADLVMEDENNNQVNNQGISEEGDQITLYVRAGCDNRKYGACPFCQRIFMFLMLKSEQGVDIKFQVATVPTTRVLPTSQSPWFAKFAF